MFNLEDDPFEKNNIADLFSEIVEPIEKCLIKFENANQIIESEEDGKTKEIEDELKKMGYV